MSYRVYVGRLPDSLSQDDFEKMLNEHGKPKNIEWKSGYAYVDYKHGSHAANTVQNLNGKEIDGNNILVELARNGGGGYSVAGGFNVSKPLPRPVRTPYRVRIENLSTRAKWMELKELLSIAGQVTFADTHKRKQGEGIVEFGTKKDMREAIHMFDKTIFFGKTIRLYDESLDFKNRRESRSRSRSPVRRRSPPSFRDRRRKSRSPERKQPDRRSESSRKIWSKSSSPQRKSEKHKRSKSQSTSPNRQTSKKHRSRSASPKHSTHEHKKSRKSHSRSKSPKRNKKQEKSKKTKKQRKSYSSSSSDEEDGKDVKRNDAKRKSKKAHKQKKSSSESDSGSSSSNSSDSDQK